MAVQRTPHRIVWVFAAGYFLCYIPYCATVKWITSPASGHPSLSFLTILPPTIVGTLLAALVGLALSGWWKYIALPRPAVVLSGIGAAMIIATTTIAFTFEGVSILLVLVLLRGGVLILAPIVDKACARRVRWFSWAALALSGVALGVAFMDQESYWLSAAVMLNLSAYLAGYCLRLPCMTVVAKLDDREATRRYFVQEMLVALAVLMVLSLVALAVGGSPIPHMGQGISIVAFIAGVFYFALYVFGTMVYLDKRENTFCVPLNRGASMLAGVVASYWMAQVAGFAIPSISQLLAAAIILMAITLLSPIHHLFEFHFLKRPKRAASRVPERLGLSTSFRAE